MTAVRAAVTDEVRAAFDRALARSSEDAAVSLVLDLLDRGVRAEEVLLGLIAPAQAVVGARWAANEWSVAQEHAATHVSDLAVSALATATRGIPARFGSVVVACPDGEWHSLPARIVAEVLRLRGFAVHFLGTGVPTAHLLSYQHQHGADVMALSCMLAARLPRVYGTIGACRRAGVPVLAGGAGFGPDGVWARALGADLYARTAADAADLLTERWPPRPSGRVSLDHLADGEYAELVSRRQESLDAMLRVLHRRFPPMRTYTEDQREAVVEDLGFLLDNLAAAAFVDDARVFTDFLDFTAGMLAARGVPPGCLHLAVQALGGPLHDLPRSLGHLTAGRSTLELAGHASPG